MDGPHLPSHHHDHVPRPKNQRNHEQEEMGDHEQGRMIMSRALHILFHLVIHFMFSMELTLYVFHTFIFHIVQ
jgi:hypothetical protein